MNDEKKTVQLLTVLDAQGKAIVSINDDKSMHTVAVTMTKGEDARPIQPGQTMMMLEAEDAPGRFKVTGEYTHPGPAHVTTDEYRVGWENIFGKRKVRPEDLN